MEKYILTIEFRYKGVPKSDIDSECKSKTITIGIYTTFDDACAAGNKVLEGFESKFPLHVFPNGRGTARRVRFSKNGGCFGSKKKLITNLAYLTTPFEFYAKIDTLKFDDIMATIDGVVKSVKVYREYRSNGE